jgi:hypothetical protein
LTAHKRRRFLAGCILLWLGPGAVVTWIFWQALWWLQIQSWLAMLFALVGAFAAETPVEPESGDANP